MPPDKDEYAGFTKERKHISLKPVPQRRPPKKKAERKEGSRPFYMFTSKTYYGNLEHEADRIYEKSKKSEIVYPDSRVYFNVTFSANLDWREIQETLTNLHGTVVKQIDNKSVKLGIRKSDYPQFLLAVHEGRKVIEKIGETTLEEKIDPHLSQIIYQEPDKTVEVTLQFLDVAGLKDLQSLEKSLKQYLTGKQLGNIEQVYIGNNWAVYNMTVKAKTIPDIAEAIGILEKVDIMPPIELVRDITTFWSDDIKLASVISLTHQNELLEPLPSQPIRKEERKPVIQTTFA